ncbi:MAG: hypothetical protein JO324_01910 [Candidatus Eremiobacteraeota bacterium]|nr:hypothetical protein [Candidatus Eremiobacteraeota bacterium]
MDWIDPINSLDPATYPGCQSPGSPCQLNFTVRPSVPALQGKPFATLFDFVQSSSNTASRSSTTSWAIGGKVSAEGSITYGDCEVGSCGSIEVQASVSAKYASKVKKFSSQYGGATDSVSLTTGFSDYLFYTQQRMNYYYYPVIGQTVCPAGKPNCAASEKVPMVAVFSAPDNVSHVHADGIFQEWYQPAHEPGNALSYPWGGSGQTPLALVALEYPNLNVDEISDPGENWSATDTSTSDYSKTWAHGSASGQTSGSTASQAFDSSITIAGKAEGLAGSAEASATIEVNQSFSMKQLNTTTSTVSSSTGITASKPAFDNNVMDNYLYDYSAAIFGLENLASDTPPQNIDLGVNVPTSGPLVVAYLADVRTPNSPGWHQAYAAHADVGLQHPQRWTWTQSTLSVAFNAFDLGADRHKAPIDQPFYRMKGFFITPHDAAGQGPSMTMISPADQLDLRVRVYNYSLVDTNQAGATKVKVRVYGNLFDTVHDVLLGDSFVIGETQIDSIPGYQSNTNQATQPNWTIATVPFNPAAFAATNNGNVYLAFWVVVWMEDPFGNLVAEIDDHGLSSSPAPLSFSSITDVPFQTHSNNVGIYGYSSPIFVCPAALPCGISPSALGSGPRGNEQVAVQNVAVSSTPLLVDQPTKVTAQLRSANVDGPIAVAYYDGDPNAGGKLFHTHHITMRSFDTYLSKAQYTPQACGSHTLHVVSRVGSVAPAESGQVTINVTIDPAKAVQELINVTLRAHAPPKQESKLLQDLNKAARAFPLHVGQGLDALRDFIRDVGKSPPGREAHNGSLSAQDANLLTTLATRIIDCI